MRANISDLTKTRRFLTEEPLPNEEFVERFDIGSCEDFVNEPLPNEVGEGSSRAVQANARGRARFGCVWRALPSPGNLAERSISDPSRGAGGVPQVGAEPIPKSGTPSIAYRVLVITALLLSGLIPKPAFAQTEHHGALATQFKSPPKQSFPETWFHLIGGNVNRDALTTDLEAVAQSGISGIQLFHGRGRVWPGVQPQIQTLSPTWDALIGKVANETERLNLKFTMQNCPGWAMSGGPWITPNKAMRHLITSRQNIAGGTSVSIELAVPQPSSEPWRDFRDIAVLAFPTPDGDTVQWIIPDEVTSSLPDAPWTDLLAGNDDAKVQVAVAGDEPNWATFRFAGPLTLRSIELPPMEHLMKRMMFDPDSSITISAMLDGQWKEMITHVIPRGNWQDRQDDVPYVIVVPDATSDRYRLSFQNGRAMELSQLRFSTTARLQDWRGQAGYALRSLERRPPPKQSPGAWINQDAIVDVTDQVDADGRLNWNAPEGDWTIVRFGHVNTGVKNKPAPPEATGFECDKLATAGADQHFAGYIGRLAKPGGPIDGGRLQGMLIDSWECYTQTWTPAMEREFETRRGYSLRPWMPALAGWVVNDHQSSERFLRDWRATISDLIVENYYGRLAELGRERGLQLSYETSVGDVSPGDILQYFKSADIPMCEVWQPNDPHDGGLETKPIAPTASAAHIYGKPRIAAEAFTSVPTNWKEHPFALKNVADRSFAAGITHMVFHTYTHNPLDEVPGTSFGNSIGTPFLRGQTWWEHMPVFTEYLARCGFLLEQGHCVADVLWYLGDDVDHKPRGDEPFPNGYQFDYVNADALLTRMSVDDGDIVNPEGNRWRVLWLPENHCRRMTPATLRKIKQLLVDGATVIGDPPQMNPSLSGGKQADMEFDALVNELWGDASRGDAGRGDRTIGNGRLMWGDDLETSLLERNITPDVTGTLPERWCHRRVDDTDIYFVIGDRNQAVNANLHFRARGTPEFYNPVDGSVTPVSVFQRTETGTVVPVQLPVSGSVFVVFRPETTDPLVKRVAFDGDVLLDVTDMERVDTSPAYPFLGVSRTEPIQPWTPPESLTVNWSVDGSRMVAWQNGDYTIHRDHEQPLSIEVSGTETIPLQSNWKLSFPDGWDTPVAMELDRVGPWSELDEKAVRHFSGTAKYETTFQLGELDFDDQLLLDLGRVGDIARVTLNGNDVGTLWTWPFRVDVTRFVKRGKNRLSIEVTNTWHNRLAYDANLRPDKRKTWTFSGPSKDSPLEFAGLGQDVQLRIGKLVSVSTGGDPIRPPSGRLAIVADGNSPDPDDIGATAVIFGILDASGLKDRLVHLSHSCDLKPAAKIPPADELRRQKVLHKLCDYGVAKYGPFPNLAGHFNCRTDQQAAVDDLRDAINASSAGDPLWIIEAGEPDIIGYALQAAGPEKCHHVHVVSHHPANDNAGDFFTWQQILDFGVTEHQIGDQNVGLKTAISPWDWAKNHSDERIQWIWKNFDYAERDGIVKFQTGRFDCSDAGMVYWWITGADRGGCRHATPPDIKKMLLLRTGNE